MEELVNEFNERPKTGRMSLEEEEETTSRDVATWQKGNQTRLWLCRNRTGFYAERSRLWLNLEIDA